MENKYKKYLREDAWDDFSFHLSDNLIFVFAVASGIVIYELLGFSLGYFWFIPVMTVWVCMIFVNYVGFGFK